jgi:hypothetical protein
MNFQDQGFLVMRNVIPLSEIRFLKKTLIKNIKKCSEQLDVSEKEYLSAVSRWVSPSPIIPYLSPFLLKSLIESSQKIVSGDPVLTKFNIICKNAYCSGSVPYHQDIAYSSQEPYQFSGWLALDDIVEDSGPLEVIPGSHLNLISPAVDFWSPDFVPDLSLKKLAKKILLAAGDIVFFDSRLWHGSPENKALSSRYALVTRWKTKNWAPLQPIPPIEAKYFGMWTAGQITQEVLSEGFQIFFQRQESDFIKLIDSWIEKIKNGSLPFYIDPPLVIESLKKVKILHLAYLKHNGGDATGTLYKNLWECFLSPLKNSFQAVEQKRGSL